jgi:alkaline phosphatase D
MRVFLIVLLGTVTAKAATFVSPGPPFLRGGPMLGHVSSTNAYIWAQASRPAKLSVRISENPDLSKSRTLRGPTLEADADCMGELVVNGLQPSRRYSYCVLLDGDPVMSRPYPSFVTAPVEGTPGHVRFAFTSCVGDHGYDAAAGYADMATRTNIDLLFMLGDNHYANTNDPTRQRSFYADQRRQPGWRELTETVPTYAIWDDHDYGPDNSDGTMPGKELSLRTFKEHWANPSYGEPDNRGIYFKFTRGNVDFLMLDDRYYRTPDKATNAPNRTMLGERQKAWLKRELLASRATIKVVACGSEFQSNGTIDGYGNFRQERDEILQYIEDNQIAGVLLISGDRHFTAGYQVLGKWIEITVGPIGSNNADAKAVSEMFLMFPPTKSKFYCVYDINTVPAPPKVTLEVYRVGEGLAFKRAFSWEEV